MQTHAINCEVCGKRNDAQYCSGACREADYLHRRSGRRLVFDRGLADEHDRDGW